MSLCFTLLQELQIWLIGSDSIFCYSETKAKLCKMAHPHVATSESIGAMLVSWISRSACLGKACAAEWCSWCTLTQLLTYLDSHYNACWCWPRCLASCWADCLFGIISNYRSPILPNHCQNHHWSKMKTLLTWQMFTLSKYCGARFELQQPAELDVNVDLTSIIMQQSWILC